MIVSKPEPQTVISESELEFDMEKEVNAGKSRKPGSQPTPSSIQAANSKKKGEITFTLLFSILFNDILCSHLGFESTLWCNNTA